MTQQKLGAMVGVSYRTIRSWEVEGRYPKQSEGQLLATNAYALLTSDYFSFSKTQCAVFKGTDLNDTQQKIIKLLSEDHQLSAVKLTCKRYNITNIRISKNI